LTLRKILSPNAFKEIMKDTSESVFFRTEGIELLKKTPVPTQLLTVLYNHRKPSLQELPEPCIKKTLSDIQRN